MAAFDFPSSPSVNQTYTANGVTWKWNGAMWMRVSGAGYLEKIEEGNSKVEVDDSGSGNVTVTTDGTEKLRIDSSGNLGLGTQTPNKNSWNKAVTLEGSSNCAYEISDNGTLAAAFALQGNDRIELMNFRAGPLTFKTQNTERLRIDSDGRLLLGLNASAGGHAFFQVHGSGNKKAQFHQPDSGNCHIQFTNTQTGSSSNNGVEIGLGGDEQAQIWNYYNSYFRIATNNTERLRIDNGGRLGLGVVPEAFHSNNKAVIRGDSGYTILGRGDNSLNISQNFYYDSSDAGKYIANGEASLYNQSDGSHSFYNAVSGSANAGASMVERLRITSDGKVLINSTANSDAQLLVKSADKLHPALKLDGLSANGFSLLGDEYQTDESNFTMGIAYSSASLVTGWGVKVSPTASNEYLSSQDTYNTKHSAVRHDGDGWKFLSNSSSQTVTTDSAVTLSERLHITPDGDLQSGDITISAYCNTHNITGYSAFLSDNHANTFFGQNLRLDYSGTSGNHQLKVINQHAQIGGAGMLIGGNQSPNRNELNFYTVAANQPAGTRVDDTNKRLTIRTNGDITIRGTNSQYVEAAAFELTQASTNAIASNNGGFVSFNALRNSNSTIISHDPNSNSGRRITFPVAGSVHFSMYQDIRVSGTTGYTQGRLYKNGTADRYSLITYTNDQWDTIMMNTVVEVAANDYLEFYYTGGTINAIDYYNWCSYNFVFYPINTNRG